MTSIPFTAAHRTHKKETMTKILAAIPAYNEDVAIGSVVLRCRPYVREVLVVDDGSDDETATVARLAQASVIQHLTNRGKGAAVQAAIAYARTNGFDVMVLLDGDGQHDPALIPELLGPITRGEADIVVGTRKLSTSHMPLHRRVGQKVLDLLTSYGSKTSVTDSQCGFRALSRAAIDSLDLDANDFSIESEMIIDAQEKNLRVVEVPISVRYDVDGSTKNPLSHGFGVMDRVLGIIAVRHPLLFFGMVGGTLFIIGVAIGFVALETYRSAPSLAIGYSFLVVIFLIVGGLATFAGIMLNVLPRAVARGLRSSGK